MRTPATAGPTMRAALNEAELSATALPTSSRPTSSTTKDWRTGWSTALTKPRMSASAHTCQYWTAPVQTRTASNTAWQRYVVWLAMSTRRLCSRSAAAPATIENSSTGANCSVLISPSLSGEPVSWSTSQDWATAWIQPPTWATSWVR